MKTRYFLVFLTLASCEKTVTPTLNTTTAQIVIQGAVTNAPGPYSITINQSVGFYDNNDFPPLSGAKVAIRDGQGMTDTLSETTPGNYTTHSLQGEPGTSYTLTVASGQMTYTATSIMPQPVPLNSISFLSTGGRSTRISAVANFQDPPGMNNYYRFEEIHNGTLLNKDIFVFDDRLSDGRYISNELRLDSAYLNAGDHLQVNMYCIDANVYNYWYQLQLASGSGTFNTSASPANPASNISNGALGYFSAQTSMSMQTTVN